MLTFNPNKRLSANQLLKHKLFDKIRVQDLEEGAPHKINLKVDQQNAFNYETSEDLLFTKKSDYRREIL